MLRDGQRSHSPYGCCGTFHGGQCELSYTYLPPYSPDFNPIELVFGWIKGRISGKTEGNMCQVIEETISSVSNEKINNFISFALASQKFLTFPVIVALFLVVNICQQKMKQENMIFQGNGAEISNRRTITYHTRHAICYSSIVLLFLF